MEYYDIYLKRLNRFGTDYQSRLQGKREKNFEYYRARSVYKTTVTYEDKIIECVFEPNKQDASQKIHYLLTDRDVFIPNGTVLIFPSFDDATNKPMRGTPWMVYYMEQISASGYNRYIMIKMSHLLQWVDRSGVQRETYAYFHAAMTGTIADAVKQGTGITPKFYFLEDENKSYIIMPSNDYLNKDDYFEVIVGKTQEQFRVTGFDRISSPGVEYVTLDKIYRFDTTPPPVKTEEDKDDDFFWLGGL